MEQTTLQVAQPQKENIVLTPQNAFSTTDGFELIQRIGKTFGQSGLVPQQYQMKSPNDTQAMANCIIAVDMAQRMQANPLMVMQNLYIVHGNPGWSSKFLIACLNNSGKFSPLRYEYKSEQGKDDWGCRAKAIDLKTGEELAGAWVTIEMAKKEGWYGKQGSKWQSMPELMLQYRAAAFFQRTYAPEISMGMQTIEEVQDTIVDSPRPIITKADPTATADVPQAEVVSVEQQATADAEQAQAAAELFG